MTEQHRPIDEIEAELAAAKSAFQHEASERKAAVPMIFQWSIFRDARFAGAFNRLRDDSLVYYRLEATCLNREEAVAAGHHVEVGGMSYLYNTANHPIVMPGSGGRVYFSSDAAYTELEAFLLDWPDGGDVTDVILREQARPRDERGGW